VKIRTDLDKRVVSFQASERKVFTPGKPRRPRQNRGVTDEQYAGQLAEFATVAAAWIRRTRTTWSRRKPAKSGK